MNELETLVLAVGFGTGVALGIQHLFNKYGEYREKHPKATFVNPVLPMDGIMERKGYTRHVSECNKEKFNFEPKTIFGKYAKGIGYFEPKESSI